MFRLLDASRGYFKLIFMLRTIQKQLSLLEEKENIRILFAIESGSRAWGFASKDSDFDVRFVYARSKDFYLSIEDKKDVIELPINEVLDVNGWDIRKALKLFKGSNAALYEWIQSPIVYKNDFGFKAQLQTLSNDYFSLRAGIHHYISMTKSVYEGDLKSSEAKLKKYFYALRHALASRWIRKFKEVPPMEFSILRQLIIDDLEINKLIDEWLVLKTEGDESTLVERNELVNKFLLREVAEGELFAREVEKKEGGVEALNRLFRESIFN
jgi:uncharacterized protein